MVMLHDTSSDTELKNDEDNVIIRRKGYGSVIDRLPVFSEDGKWVQHSEVMCNSIPLYYFFRIYTGVNSA